MSSHKRKAEKYNKSDPFVASDDETYTKRPSKKAKSVLSSSNGLPPEMMKDEEGNQYWEISKSRRVTVSDFKGKKMVSIREYYEKDGKQLPGKKGITMTIEQYSTLITLLPEIEEVLSASGENVPRPKYDGGPVAKAASHDAEDEDDENSEDKKANFEATSDEDED